MVTAIRTTLARAGVAQPLQRLAADSGYWSIMRARLDAGPGKAYYAQRSRTVEPVFGQVKTVHGGCRFMRRGLLACQAEWQLLCGTHNLLKLWRTTTARSR